MDPFTCEILLELLRGLAPGNGCCNVSDLQQAMTNYQLDFGSPAVQEFGTFCVTDADGMVDYSRFLSIAAQMTGGGSPEAGGSPQAPMPPPQAMQAMQQHRMHHPAPKMKPAARMPKGGGPKYEPLPEGRGGSRGHNHIGPRKIRPRSNQKPARGILPSDPDPMEFMRGHKQVDGPNPVGVSTVVFGGESNEDGAQTGDRNEQIRIALAAYDAGRVHSAQFEAQLECVIGGPLPPRAQQLLQAGHVSLQHLVKELGNYAPPKPLLKGMSSGGTVKSFNGSHNQLAGQGEFKHGADFGMEFAAVVNRQDPSSLRKTNQCSKGNPLAVAPDMKKIYADE